MVTKIKLRKTAPSSQNPPAPLAVLPPITTTFPPPLSICSPPPPPPPPQPTVSFADEEPSVKLAVAISLLKSKLLSQPQPQQQQQGQRQQSQSQQMRAPFQSLSSDALRWKQKAKERKNEILRLKKEIKQLEDDMQCDLYPQSASCKCYFFNDVEKENINHTNFEQHGSEFSGGDHQCSRFSDALRRRFLRQVRLNERKKKRAAKNVTGRHSFSEFCKEEEEMEQLKLSADFLVDLCETPCPVKNPHFTNLAHQAVDFILGSLNHFIAMGKDLNLMEDVTCSLIMRLVKRMCTPIGDVLYDRKNDMQIHVQHIIRKLASISFVGQRVLLSVSHRISEDAEKLLSLDPFDKAFPLIHDSAFFMIQLVESLVSNYLVTWSKDEGFDTRLFQEWVTSLLQARKSLQLLEKRSGLYILYMDRVIRELAGQVGQFSAFQQLNENIIDNLYS